MKKLVASVCVLIFSFPAFGQQITKVDADLHDYVMLLEAAGYELFSFDISEIEEGQTIVVEAKEYEKGSEIDKHPYLNEKLTSRAEKINFGFYPSGNDSTKLMQLTIPGHLSKNRLSFNLRRLQVSDYPDRTFYRYNTRPFKLDKITENEFTPLFLLGSFWYDNKSKIFRFCGENEIAPDMSSDILQHLPHYFVIGITVKQRTEN